MPRDRQRSRVYEWENERGFQRHDIISINEISKLVATIWSTYAGINGKRLPKVTDGRGRGRACCTHLNPVETVLKFPIHSRKEHVVFHEVAHALNRDRSGGAHGWSWLSIYVDLLVEYGGYSRNRLLAEISDLGLDEK